MNTLLIAFLLGLAPNTDLGPTIQQQWSELTVREQSALLSHFEDEYHVRIHELDETALNQLIRHQQFRAVDHVF